MPDAHIPRLQGTAPAMQNGVPIIAGEDDMRDCCCCECAGNWYKYKLEYYHYDDSYECQYGEVYSTEYIALCGDGGAGCYAAPGVYWVKWTVASGPYSCEEDVPL